MWNCKTCLYQYEQVTQDPCKDCALSQADIGNWAPKKLGESSSPTLIKMSDVSNDSLHWSVDQMLKEAVELQRAEGFKQAVVIFAIDRRKKSEYYLRVLKRGSDGQIITMLRAADTMEIRELIGTGLAEIVPILDPEA